MLLFQIVTTQKECDCSCWYVHGVFSVYVIHQIKSLTPSSLLNGNRSFKKTHYNMSVISARYLLYGSPLVAHYHLALTMVNAWGSRPNTAVLPHTRRQTAVCNKVIFCYLHSPHTPAPGIVSLVLKLCEHAVRQVTSKRARKRYWQPRRGLYNLIKLHLEWFYVNGFSSSSHIDSDALGSGCPQPAITSAYSRFDLTESKRHKLP